MVGKKNKGGNLITIIKKDPNLKPGEVEIPVEDILNGSKPFNLTLYGYFIEKRVNFFNMNKYALSLKEVLDGGSWLVFDNPIIIRRWEPGLNLSKSQHNSIPVWVKIFNAPLEYWNCTGLSHIAWELGKPLEDDAWTTKMCHENWGRPAFMRILMEISAEEWLKELNVYSRDMVKGERVLTKCKIEYAWSPSKFSHWKVFGHKDSNCGILIAIDLKMKEAKGKEHAIQDVKKINLIDEMLKKTVPFKVHGDAFEVVTKKNTNWNKGEASKAGNGVVNQKKGQGQNRNFNKNGSNKATQNRNNGNGQFGVNLRAVQGQNNGGKGRNPNQKVGTIRDRKWGAENQRWAVLEEIKGAAREEWARNNGSVKGNMGNDKVSPKKQVYVPKIGVDLKISSNFDQNTTKMKANFVPKMILKNMFDGLLDDVNMEEQVQKENVNPATINLKDDDLLDEEDVTLEDVLVEETEGVLGANVSDTNQANNIDE
ncbi:hypothetical protein LXL04_028701 [Taraxacum kok-saghyz]